MVKNYYSWKGKLKDHFLPSDFEVIPLKYVFDPVKRRALCKIIPSRQVLGTLLPWRFLSSYWTRVWTCLGGESRPSHFNGRVFVRLVKEAITINGSWCQGHCYGNFRISSFQKHGSFCILLFNTFNFNSIQNNSNLNNCHSDHFNDQSSVSLDEFNPVNSIYFISLSYWFLSRRIPVSTVKVLVMFKNKYYSICYCGDKYIFFTLFPFVWVVSPVAAYKCSCIDK